MGNKSSSIDLTKRRFKIEETINGARKFLRVWVEVPRYKKPWWGKAYYDENDLIWAVMGSHGGLIPRGQTISIADFANITDAREFVKLVKAEKKVTIIEEE